MQQFAQREPFRPGWRCTARVWSGKYRNTRASFRAGGLGDFNIGSGTLKPWRQTGSRQRNQAGLAIVAGIAGSGVRRFHVIVRPVSEWLPHPQGIMQDRSVTRIAEDSIPPWESPGGGGMGTNRIRGTGANSLRSTSRGTLRFRKNHPGWCEGRQRRMIALSGPCQLKTSLRRRPSWTGGCDRSGRYLLQERSSRSWVSLPVYRTMTRANLR